MCTRFRTARAQLRDEKEEEEEESKRHDALEITSPVAAAAAGLSSDFLAWENRSRWVLFPSLLLSPPLRSPAGHLFLHPTSYPLHPTPYILHPTLYTLRPAPYTKHPTPYTLRPAP